MNLFNQIKTNNNDCYIETEKVLNSISHKLSNEFFSLKNDFIIRLNDINIKAVASCKPNSWTNEKKEPIHEININCDHLIDFYQNTAEIIKSILHELCHLHLFDDGHINHVSKNGYHKKIFWNILNIYVNVETIKKFPGGIEHDLKINVLDFLDKKCFSDLVNLNSQLKQLYKLRKPEEEKKEQKKKTIVLICPVCEKKARVSSGSNFKLNCIECNEQLLGA